MTARRPPAHLSLLKVKDSLLTGIREIFYHPLRSSLTLICIMLGVAALIAMMGIMDGFKRSFIEISNSQGGNSRLGISNLNDQEKAELAKKYKIKGLTVDDVAVLLKEHSDDIKYIIPQVSLDHATVTRGNKSMRMWMWSAIGTTKEYRNVDNLTMEKGRNITPVDDITRARVCVIGSIMQYEFFDDFENPIGGKISVNGVSFTVVGTFKHEFVEPPSLFGNPKDSRDAKRQIEERSKKARIDMPVRAVNLKKQQARQEGHGRQLWEKYGKGNAVWQKNLRIIIPFSTFQSIFKENDLLDSCDIILKSSENLAGKMEAFKETLKKAHNGAEDFRINPWSMYFEDANKQIALLKLVFLFISGIALFVGGIGVMNVILASISERIREIGVRKSVGARNVDIFVQFLIETMVLAVLGGILGTLLGIALANFFGWIASMRIFISWYSILLAVGVSSGIGLVFGVYPAIKAARLNPIDALRYE